MRCLRHWFVWTAGLAALATILLILAWLILMPSVNSIRPQLESYLKRELRLDTLRIGHLSWTWRGHLWIQAEPVSFASRNRGIKLSHANLAVQLDMLEILRGKAKVRSLKIHGGNLWIDLIKTGGAPFPPIETVYLKGINVHWSHGKLEGLLPQLVLSFDGDKGVVLARSKAMRLRATMDDAGRPTYLDLHLLDSTLLPKPLRAMLLGDVTLSLYLYREEQGWHARVALSSATDGAVQMNSHPEPWPFQRIELSLSLPGGLDAKRAHFSFLWFDHGDEISGEGACTPDTLRLQLHSGRLHLRKLWPHFATLGADDLRAWLDSMHAGVMDRIEGEWSLPLQWKSRIPYPLPERGMAYRVSGALSGAELSLDTQGHRLTDLAGKLKVDQSGLELHVERAKLPEGTGVVEGNLRIPAWKIPIPLLIHGHARFEVEKLKRFMSIHPLPFLKWETSPAEGWFDLHWVAGEDEPAEGTARIVPAGTWTGKLANYDIALMDGHFVWDHARGVTGNALHVVIAGLHGKGSFVTHREGKEWRLEEVKLRIEDDAQALAQRAHPPIDGLEGRVCMDLSYDKAWNIKVDLKDAAWRNFLGNRKARGDPYAVSASLEEASGGRWIVKRLSGEGLGPRFSGEGWAEAHQWTLGLHRLETESFHGQLKITKMEGKPVDVFIDADWIKEGFIPESMPIQSVRGHEWRLHARIGTFTFQSMTLEHVVFHLQSNPDSVGRFHALRVKTADILAQDVTSFFTLPHPGVLDLHVLKAKFLGQSLSVSAVLEDRKGGTAWRGFMMLEGEFEPLILRLDVAKKFKGGRVYALIHGQGLIVPGKPWWHGLSGRLRMRVDDGRILEGGTLTRLLAAASLSDLPRLLFGRRKDLFGPGMHYRRLQIEANLDGKHVHIRKLALRASALDMAGTGELDLETSGTDMILVVRPLQNLDAILSRIPLLRDLLGGAAHSFMRKVYRVQGPLTDAQVKAISPEQAGLAAPGLIERLLNLPSRWFGEMKPAPGV